MTTLNGPWKKAFYVQLPTALHSKSNYRHNSKKGAWSSLRNFEMVSGITLASAIPDGWELGEVTSPVKNRPVVVMAIVARSMLDASNFSKSLADAAEGVVVHNDASISAVSSVGERGRKDPRVGVAFAQLPAGSGLEEQAAALSELTAAAVRRFTTPVD